MKQTYVPLDKQSKKKKKEFYNLMRGSWDVLSPVTHATQESKAYNRAKEKNRRDYDDGSSLFRSCFS